VRGIRSGSDYADSLAEMMRPRQEFPTPLFKIVAPVVYLATA
jgi:hypothetical protein